jgi:hypothetical protein
MGANAEFCFKSKGYKSLDSSQYRQCKVCRHVFASHSRILIRWLTQRKLSEAVAYLRTSSATNVGADKGQLSAASGGNPASRSARFVLVDEFSDPRCSTPTRLPNNLVSVNCSTGLRTTACGRTVWGWRILRASNALCFH